MAIGGDVLRISFKHPRLGSGKLSIKSGETSQFDPGGFRTNDDEKGVTADGEAIYEMTNSRWRWEGTVRNDMNNAKDLELLADMAADPEEAQFTITHINGAIYGGYGKPVGNVRADGKAATIPLVLSGGGQLTQV